MAPQHSWTMWAVSVLYIVMTIIVITRGMARVHLIYGVAEQKRRLRGWFLRVFALGPTLILLGAGILLGHLWSSPSMEGITPWFPLLFGCVLLAYVVAELLQSMFFDPTDERMLTVRHIMGVWLPLLLGAVVLAVLLAYSMLEWV